MILLLSHYDASDFDPIRPADQSGGQFTQPSDPGSHGINPTHGPLPTLPSPSLSLFGPGDRTVGALTRAGRQNGLYGQIAAHLGEPNSPPSPTPTATAQRLGGPSLAGLLATRSSAWSPVNVPGPIAVN